MYDKETWWIDERDVEDYTVDYFLTDLGGDVAEILMGKNATIVHETLMEVLQEQLLLTSPQEIINRLQATK